MILSVSCCARVDLPLCVEIEAENGIFAHLRQSRRRGRLRTPALGLVGAAAEPAFNVDLLPLGQILVAGVGQLAKSRAVEPFGFFPLLSGTGGVLPVAGDGEAGNAPRLGVQRIFRSLPELPIIIFLVTIEGVSLLVGGPARSP